MRIDRQIEILPTIHVLRFLQDAKFGIDGAFRDGGRFPDVPSDVIQVSLELGVPALRFGVTQLAP